MIIFQIHICNVFILHDFFRKNVFMLIICYFDQQFHSEKIRLISFIFWLIKIGNFLIKFMNKFFICA